VCFGEELRLLAEQQRGYPGWETRLVRRVRQLGLDHVLFVIDWVSQDKRLRFFGTLCTELSHAR
jgi:hypothetical protein